MAGGGMKRLLALLALLPGLALAQVYPYFPPPYAQGPQPSGLFFASPCSSTGPVTFRSLCASDFSAGFLAPLNLTLTDPGSNGGNPSNGNLYSLSTRTSASGTSGSQRFWSAFFSTNDTGALDAGSGYSATLDAEFYVNGPSLTGSRATSRFYMEVDAPTNNQLPGNTSYGASNSICVGKGNDNGTGTTTATAHGNCSTSNWIGQLTSTATNWYALGGEIDTNMNFGSSVALNRGLQIAKISGNQAVGSQDDYAIGLGNQATNATYGATGTQTTTGTAGQFSCSPCANVVVGDALKIVGTNTGSGTITGYVSGNQYFVSATNGTSTFTLQDQNHNPLTTTAGSLTGLSFVGTWAGWGWAHGYTLCGSPCVFPIALTGSILDSELAGTVKNIIDYHLVNCTSFELRLSVLSSDCSGNVTANTITATGGASTLSGGTVAINQGAGSSITQIGNGTTTGNVNIGGTSNQVNFGSQVNLATNNLSSSSWGTAGLVYGGASRTLTDTTASGTITTEVAAALPAYTLTTPSNAITVTNLDTLYLAAPIAGTNVTATNLNSLDAAGRISGTGGAGISGGVINFNNNSNNNVNINTGTSTGTLTLGGSSALVNVGAPVVVGSATGGSQGVGTVNATGLFVNGVAVGGGASGANPTGTVGLSAVNGVASTFLRSDGAPPLSQSIAPTWTGVHTWTLTQAANTSTDGVVLADTTAASAANQQYSPRLRLTGQGWKTNATAASQSFDYIIENQPVQGAANPTGNLVISAQVNGGGYNFVGEFLSNGAVNGGVLQMVGNPSSSAPQYSFTGATNYGMTCCSSVNGAGGLNLIASGAIDLTANTKGVYISGVPLAVSGTLPTISGCGTAGSIAGGTSAFTFTVGTGASPCTFTVTFASSQVHDYICIAQDRTSNIMLPETTGQAANTCVFKGNAATSDVISVVAIGR
jgi:hypothetical protein